MEKKNIKIAFLHVNYNNSEITIKCINSIIENDDNSKIIIIDNASSKTEKDKLIDWEIANPLYSNRVVFLFENINHGYFKAFNIGLKYLQDNISDYKYVVIGNNDLIFENVFFSHLRTTNIDEKVYVISPNIIKTNGIHQKPYSLNKTSKLRKLLYHLIYSNYWMAVLILGVSDALKIKKSESDKKGYDKSQKIFAGHGACYVLTQSSFKYNFLLDDRSFLMGEEFLLAKQIRDTKGEILYLNNLIVTHDEHTTMKKIPSKTIYIYSQEAFKLFKDIC